MTRGPEKQFDPKEVLEKAMHVFWAKGYAATGMAELQAEMGIGRKSIYDTFGSKRELFIQALQHYADTVTNQALEELDRDGSPLGNVRRLLRKLQERNSVPGCTGCLVGVAMAEFRNDDAEMAEILRRHAKSMEDGLHRTFKRAQSLGELAPETNVRDLARFYVSVLQGLALLGRVDGKPAVPRSIVNTALATLDRF